VAAQEGKAISPPDDLLSGKLAPLTRLLGFADQLSADPKITADVLVPGQFLLVIQLRSFLQTRDVEQFVFRMLISLAVELEHAFSFRLIDRSASPFSWGRLR
jgi:hypothetical protein